MPFPPDFLKRLFNHDLCYSGITIRCGIKSTLIFGKYPEGTSSGVLDVANGMNLYMNGSSLKHMFPFWSFTFDLVILLTRYDDFSPERKL